MNIGKNTHLGNYCTGYEKISYFQKNTLALQPR
jgi:hypothetical protein